MSLEEVRQELDQLEKKNAAKRNQKISEELLNYSEDLESVDYAVEYWSDVENSVSSQKY